MLPLSEETNHSLPAPEIIGTSLGLAGVLDTSKFGAASLFYLPSGEVDQLDQHHTEIIAGNAIDAAWMREQAGALLAERQAEQVGIAAAAHAAAAARRETKVSAGFDPDDSLIEKLRPHFDLEDVLLSHGYDKERRKIQTSQFRTQARTAPTSRGTATSTESTRIMPTIRCIATICRPGATV